MAREQANSSSALIDAAREFEPDRYLAALLAPSAVRADLLTLAAFAAELGRITAAASEPFPGEVRLQWWRDALTGTPQSGSGVPLAEAMADLLARHRIDRPLLDAVLDARAADLYVDPPVDHVDLTSRLAHGEGGLFLMALRVTGHGDDDRAAVLAARAGEAYGLARETPLRPARCRRGPLVPADLLAAEGLALDDLATADGMTRAAPLADRLRGWALDALSNVARDLDPAARCALLPLAMVKPYLSAQQSATNGPSPLRRVWRLWRAKRSGRW